MNSLFTMNRTFSGSGEIPTNGIISIIAILMMMMGLLFASPANLKSQETNALTLSDYSGISGAMINPALMTGSKVFLDVNIIGANAHASNNMAYFLPENKTLGKIIRFDTLNLNDGGFKYGRNYNYIDNENSKYLASNVKAMGPSGMVQINHHAIGLSTNFRSVNGGNNIPYEIPIILYEGLEFEKYQGQEFDEYNYSFVSMTWSEIGLSYAYDLVNYYDDKFTVGITAKALFGHEGGYVAMSHANFIIHDKKSIDFKDVDAEIAYSIPYDEASNTLDINPLIRGYGAGFDLGIVYTKKTSVYDHPGDRGICSKPYQDYKYKIGFSVLDIGSISFNKKVESHKFEDASLYWDDYDTTHFLGVSKMLKTYSEAFYNDPEHTYQGDKMKIGLPTTISLQVDYQVRKDVYIAAMWMQPVRFNLHTLWRPAQIAVIPRYETRYIGVYMPFTLYNYSEPRLGLAIRVSSLTIGTDWLGSWTGISNFQGTDIYFSLKFNIEKGNCFSFNKGACFNSDW